MTLISSNIKSNIISKLNEIINIEDDPSWFNLDINLKLKIVHNLCNIIKNNNIITTDNNKLKIPLKNQRPKKIIQLCEINKQNNQILFNEYKENILCENINFKQTYNSKNNFYSYANLSKEKYDEILNNYNLHVYNFLQNNINYIDSKKLFDNLTYGNQHKLIFNNDDIIKINKIYCFNNYLNIDFNNNISIQFELYLTSEKITSKIPAKYKIILINIF